MADQLTFPWTSTLTAREVLLRLPDIGPWTAGELERDALDFKETPGTTLTPAHALKEATARLRTDIVETAVSLANARGGAIVIGVRDKASAGQQVVPGVNLDDWAP